MIKVGQSMLPDEVKRILEKYNKEVAEEISNINRATEKIIDELNSVSNVLVDELASYAKNTGFSNTDKEVELLQDSQVLRKYISSIALMDFRSEIIKDNDDNRLNIYSVIVLNSTLKCSYNHHSCIDVVAKIPVLINDEEIVLYPVTASYCLDCKRYSILKEDFNQISGIVMCKVIDETSNYSKVTEDEIDIEQKRSLLYEYGYNVQSKRNISSKQRHIILASVIESNLMTRRQISDHLTTLIERGSKIPKWKDATNKWKQDKHFVQTYKTENLPSFIFDEIVLKYSIRTSK